MISTLSTPFAPQRVALRRGRGAPAPRLTFNGRAKRHVVAASSGDKKSWGDIAKEAGNLAGDVIGKIAEPLKALVNKKDADAPVVQDRRSRGKSAISPRNEEEEISRALSQSLGGGLLGRAAGAMLGAGLGALGKQMRETQSQAEDVHAVASAAVCRDPRVQSALGGAVQCSKPLSVSSSSSSINGVATSTTAIQFIAQGAAGRQASVSVRATSGRTMDIVVQTATGSQIRVDAGADGAGGGAVGGVIDVEDYEVR